MTASGNKPNIMMIVSDDFGYGGAGPYLAVTQGVMATANIDSMATEGMILSPFYAEPRCTLSRAAMQTGRISNRRA